MRGPVPEDPTRGRPDRAGRLEPIPDRPPPAARPVPRGPEPLIPSDPARGWFNPRFVAVRAENPGQVPARSPAPCSTSSPSASPASSRALARGRLTDKNIEDGDPGGPPALLEADVNLEVVKAFVERVREQGGRPRAPEGRRPADQFVKVVHDEMTALLGGEAARIRWNDRGPTVIMMVGLQGTGKTTTCAKIARSLRKRDGKRPLLVAADVQRPAAVEQLKVLGQQIDVPVYSEEGGRPAEDLPPGGREGGGARLRRGPPRHRGPAPHRRRADGRAGGHPGQGLAPGDLARGGRHARPGRRPLRPRVPPAARRRPGWSSPRPTATPAAGALLAIREVTGCPIRYVGVGEKLDKIEPFVPERFAQRILGMGDVVGLVEKAQEVVDQAAAEKTAERLFTDRFTMLDMQFMFDQVQRIGGMKDLLAKLPGGASLPEGALDQMPGDAQLTAWRAIISSMTPQERMDPTILHMQRRHRIARGSGTSVGAVNEVIKAYKDMRRQMKDLKKQGLLGRMASRALDRQKAENSRRCGARAST